MTQASLYCSREKLFVNDLLIEAPSVPGNGRDKNPLEVKVDVLEVTGEKALVLLPNIMRRGDQYTAIVDIKYLK